MTSPEWSRYARALPSIAAVEPAECALLSKRAWGHHGIEGIGDGFVRRNLDVSVLTGIIMTTTEESIAIARRLAREEGIFCGISSGCNVAAALKLARRHPVLPAIEREHPLDPYTVEQLDRYEKAREIIG